MSVDNPYFYGPMVTDPAMFFGREDELARIRDRLRKGASTSLIGLRRIGKSSLLYQLTGQTDALPEGVLAVYLDLQDAAHHGPLGLLTAALQGLEQRAGQGYGYGFGAVQSLADFSTAIKRVRADGFQPTLCLDEVEELTDRPVFDDDFFEGLRALGNRGALAFVTAAGESLDVLIQQSGRSSQFYNIFSNLELSGISDEAARELLTAPFRRANLNPPSQDYIAFALDLAGHYPFYLQMLAYYLFDMRAAGQRMQREALHKLFAQDAERHLRGLWNYLNAQERESVKGLAAHPSQVAADQVERLRRCGLVEGPPQEPRLFSSHFQQQALQGVFERQLPARPSRAHHHALKEVIKASVRRPWQRWLLGILGSVSLAALALWLIFGRPSQSATLSCGAGDYTVTLDYPRHLATGDGGQINWNLHNGTTRPVTATLTLALPPAHVQFEGQGNSSTLENLQEGETRPGQVSFRRRLPTRWFWQRGLLLTPDVDLKVDSVRVACEGNVASIRTGPLHGLNSFWRWLSTTGPLGWLALAGLEWFKTIGKRLG